MGVDLKRVLLGGLVAWVVIAVFGVALVPLIGADMDLTLARFELPPLGAGAIAWFALVSLSSGMLVVGLYALMLPTINNRTTTAICAALIVWLCGYFFPNFSMVAYGFMPMQLTVIGTAWGIVELLAGSLIGTRFYRERAAP